MNDIMNKIILILQIFFLLKECARKTIVNRGSLDFDKIHFS